MKKDGRILLWALALVLTVTVTMVTAEPNIPIAWYTFNEGEGTVAYDSSGNLNHGTIHGAQYVDMGGGNYALDFTPTAEGDGGGDWVDYGDIDVRGDYPTDWSIEAWVYFRSDTYGNPVYIFGQDGEGNGLLGWWRILSWAGSRFTDLSWPEEASPTFGTWYHVVQTHDGSLDGSENEHRLYVNGSLVAQNTGGQYDNNTQRTPWVSGTQQAEYSGDLRTWLNGMIDEIALYDGVLSADEVSKRYANGPKAPAALPTMPDPIAWYTFNEGQGDTVLDESGNSNHGENRGGEYVPVSFRNYAMNFTPTALGPGGGDYVWYGDIDELYYQPHDWSIETWVYIRSGAYGNTVHIFGQDGQWVGVHGWWRWKAFGDSGIAGDVTAPFDTQFNRWYHVVAVHDGDPENTHTLYVNGQEVASGSGVHYINNWDRAAWVSGTCSDWVGQPDETVHWLDGMIDEIRFWDVPITAEQIAGLYAHGPTLIGAPSSCAQAIALGYGNPADLDGDCYVGMVDLSVFLNNWIECNDPTDASCVVTW